METYKWQTYTFRRTYAHRQPDVLTVCLDPAKGHTGQHCWQALFTDIDSQRALEGHILLFVPWVPAFGAVGAVGGWDRVDGGALFAWRMGRVGGVGEAGTRLAGVVVKLHQTEYQVRGHQLKCIRWIGYDVPTGEREQTDRPVINVTWVLLSNFWGERLTVWYIGFVCLDVHLLTDRYQSTTCYTFSELYKTGHHNSHRPARQTQKVFFN